MITIEQELFLYVMGQYMDGRPEQALLDECNLLIIEHGSVDAALDEMKRRYVVEHRPGPVH